MFQSCSKSNTSDEESGHPDAKSGEEEANEHDDGYNTGEDEEDHNKDKFNFIMTHNIIVQKMVPSNLDKYNVKNS